MYQWQKLSKEQSEAVLAKINSPEFEELFKRNRAEVSVSPLSFYNNFLLYRFTTYATMPSISVEFLSNGQDFYYLDGNPDSIYHVNKLDPLHLSKRNIVDYLDFFFTKVNKDDDADIVLIRNPEESPFVSSMGPDFKRELLQFYETIKLKYEIEPERFLLKAPMYYSGTLMSATVAIQPDGQMQLLEHRLLFGSFTSVGQQAYA